MSKVYEQGLLLKRWELGTRAPGKPPVTIHTRSGHSEPKSHQEAEVVIGEGLSRALMMRRSSFGRKTRMGAGLWGTACDRKRLFVLVQLLICEPTTKAGSTLEVRQPRLWLL